jgi:hypothetical protein
MAISHPHNCNISFAKSCILKVLGLMKQPINVLAVRALMRPAAALRCCDVMRTRSGFQVDWSRLKKPQELVHLIVARVWVKDGRVTAISLKANYHVAVGLTNETSTDIAVDGKEGALLFRWSRRSSISRWARRLGAKGWAVSPGYPPASACVTPVTGCYAPHRPA